MSDASWVDRAIDALEAGAPGVARVLLAEVRGSAPREAGACLLVAASALHGTIGGGRLEWEALALARAMLADPRGPAAVTREYVLGPELAQCCGGRARLWVDRFAAADLPTLRSLQLALRNAAGARLASQASADGVVRRVLAPVGPRRSIGLRISADALELVEEFRSERRVLLLFGAGHVGQAVARIVGELPGFELRWFDTREVINGRSAADIGHHVVVDPVAAAAAAPSGALALVMTHDHALDFDLCVALLRGARIGWLGLIASASKAARFRSRLAKVGLADACARLLTAPIGLPAITGKAPAVIAVSVVAQLLTLDAAADRGAAAPCDAVDCTHCGERTSHRRPA